MICFGRSLLRKLNKLIETSFNSRLVIISWLILASWLFIQVAWLGSFGDEQENFVAAWLISRGLVPYHDFFFHHAPLPYFIGAPLYWFKAEPWSWFRWIMLGWFSLTGGLTVWLIHPSWRWGLGLGWVGLALLTPTAHFQMFLAESWLVPAVVSLSLLIVSFWRFGRPKLKTILWLWLVLGWVAIGNSLVALPTIGWLMVGLGLAIKARGVNQKIPWLRLSLAAGFLYGSWLGYFAWHQALAESWWAILTYNLEYYFPLRLAGSIDTAQAGYLASVLSNFWFYAHQLTSQFIVANRIFAQTLVGSFQLGWADGQLLEWLKVAITEWSHQILTLPMLTWLLVLVMIGWQLRRKQGWFLVWWLGLLITLRGRENEAFKLGEYYGVVVMAAAILLVETWRQKHKTWSLLIGIILTAWMATVWPSYQAILQTPAAIISPTTLAVGEQLRQTLASQPGLSSTQSIYVLGGNPIYYLLTRRFPANRYFYYHPWFHDAPPLRQVVNNFLETNVVAPVILESEIDNSSLQYAAELEILVRARATHHQNGVYWFD